MAFKDYGGVTKVLFWGGVPAKINFLLFFTNFVFYIDIEDCEF